eukprot:PITA_33981
MQIQKEESKDPEEEEHLFQSYLWKRHVVYESRPRVVIVTFGNKLYMIQEVVLPTAISLVTVKQCIRIQVIRDWPSPTTLTELHNFLGLANFYCSFVLGFSHITWPLSQVTKGGAKAKFFWSKSQQKAFTELKDFLCSAPVLALPDLQQPIEVETNASNYAVGAFLTQHGHPMAYHSETLSDTVRKYPTNDKAMYSIVQAC